MTPGEKFWAALIATGVTVELAAAASGHDEWTLSPYGRKWTRCHTPLGRAFVTVGIGAGATWLSHHFITIPQET